MAGNAERARECTAAGEGWLRHFLAEINKKAQQADRSKLVGQCINYQFYFSTACITVIFTFLLGVLLSHY